MLFPDAELTPSVTTHFLVQLRLRQSPGWWYSDGALQFPSEEEARDHARDFSDWRIVKITTTTTTEVIP